MLVFAASSRIHQTGKFRRDDPDVRTVWGNTSHLSRRMRPQNTIGTSCERARRRLFCRDERTPWKSATTIRSRLGHKTPKIDGFAWGQRWSGSTQEQYRPSAQLVARATTTTTHTCLVCDLSVSRAHPDFIQPLQNFSAHYPTNICQTQSKEFTESNATRAGHCTRTLVSTRRRSCVAISAAVHTGHGRQHSETTGAKHNLITEQLRRCSKDGFPRQDQGLCGLLAASRSWCPARRIKRIQLELAHW